MEDTATVKEILKEKLNLKASKIINYIKCDYNNDCYSSYLYFEFYGFDTSKKLMRVPYFYSFNQFTYI
ncbi:hypothetical protein AKA01nite_02180 [Alkalibacterium kapii]|uniref:Uncharacterized protein n=1 Tax=Alkalibacterium kapii TaxID=426704 RepID=A0A511AR84_9LACT|nr:hypothetical protein AKA01nite_02180 [Alkalibacterium kapii]